MIIHSAVFEVSNTDLAKCPKGNKPEYALIGRSNVGKSSLINYLTNHNALAKISVSPGKTKVINHFLMNDEWYLVDLPGYGYAKTSRTERSSFSKMITNYILNRENMLCLFVLIDSRHEPQKNDISFINFLGEKNVPFVIVFTKIDKISSSELSKNIMSFKKEMLKNWEEIPQYFITSSATKHGKDEMLNYIEKINKEYVKAINKKI